MKKEDALGYRSLLEEHNFLRYFFARVVNRFGDSIDALAFAWMVYAITGDRSWSAIIFGFNALPSILLMPFAGVLVERMNKKRVMIVADLGRAALVTVITLLYATGSVVPWMLAATTLLISTLEAFRIPAGLALYPSIVPREKYTAATSLSQSCGSVAALIGTGAFGLIMAVAGLEGAMLVNAASFVLSSMLIARMRLPRMEKKKNPLRLDTFFGEMGQGLRYFWQKKLLLAICVVGSLLGVLLTPASSLQTPFVMESLGQGEVALSIMGIGSLAGSMIGTALFPMINRRARKSTLMIAGGMGIAIAYGLYVWLSHIAAEGVMMAALAASAFLMGLGLALLQVVVNVSFMEQVDGAYISRVGSLFNAMSSALMPAASFLVAALAKGMTVNAIFLLFGALVAVMFGGLACSRVLRGIDHVPQLTGGEAVENT